MIQDITEYLDYNPDTGEFSWKQIKKFSNRKIGSIAGCINKNGYRSIKWEGKFWRASRLAFLFMTGKFPENQVDHINRTRDDNRWDNLRDVTCAENLLNRSISDIAPRSMTGMRELPSGNYAVRDNTGQHLGTAPSIFEAWCIRKSHDNRRIN